MNNKPKFTERKYLVLLLFVTLLFFPVGYRHIIGRYIEQAFPERIAYFQIKVGLCTALFIWRLCGNGCPGRLVYEALWL